MFSIYRWTAARYLLQFLFPEYGRIPVPIEQDPLFYSVQSRKGEINYFDAIQLIFRIEGSLRYVVSCFRELIVLWSIRINEINERFVVTFKLKQQSL